MSYVLTFAVALMAGQSAGTDQQSRLYESVIYVTNNGGVRPPELVQAESRFDIMSPSWWGKFDARYIVMQGEGKTMLLLDKDLAELAKLHENTAILDAIASSSAFIEVGRLSTNAQRLLSSRFSKMIPQYVDAQRGLPAETVLQFVPFMDITLRTDDHQLRTSVEPNLRPDLEGSRTEIFYSHPLTSSHELEQRAAGARATASLALSGTAMIRLSGPGITSHRAFREAMELYEDYIDGEQAKLRFAFDRAYEKIAQDYERIEGPGEDDEVAVRDLPDRVKRIVRIGLSRSWKQFGFNSVSEVEVFSLEAKASGRKKISISVAGQGKDGRNHGMGFTIIRP